MRGGSVQCRKFRRTCEQHDASKSTLISHTRTNVDHRPTASDLCGPFDPIDLAHVGLAEVVWRTLEKGHCPYACHPSVEEARRVLLGFGIGEKDVDATLKLLPEVGANETLRFSSKDVPQPILWGARIQTVTCTKRKHLGMHHEFCQTLSTGQGVLGDIHT